MNQLTRSALAAITCGCLSLAVPAASRAQQLGAPQPYPQTQAYSQQAAPPSPYPQTPDQMPAKQSSTQQQSVEQQQPPAASMQPGGQQPAAGQAPAPQLPPGFPLNQVEEAALDAALNAWQQQSGNTKTFSCPFERWEYVKAFGPVINGRSEPLNKNLGELTYSKPDRGSFQITKITTYTQVPPPADQPNAPARGDWVVQPNAIGEHWVCDGKSVYEFRSDQKQVIERQLPQRAPGEAILDGPLPFLFGAESAKLKQRYWMKIDQRNNNPNQIWLNAWPKAQAQAADFRQVDVILDRQMLLPQAMQVTLPNDDRHVYMFNLKKADVNGVLNQIQQALFTKPSIPFGWKHVVENVPVPVAQGEQPDKPQAR
jgi:TIGR03009 family protein